MQVSEHLRKSTDGYTHWCPACGCAHHVAVDQPNDQGAVWCFDNNLKKPSFSPSVLIRYADRSGAVLAVCHYWLIDGQLRYQKDSTHGCAGQVVDLPSLPPGMRDKE